MASPLPALIDRQDSFEIVRDRIAEIISVNQAEQVVLATAAAKPDPNLWKLRVFVERSNPWEQFREDLRDATPDLSPIVNVWYERGAFPEAKGGVVDKQAHEAVFNVDVYGCGVAQGVGGGGHTPGDESAALTCQRGVRLCRSILMAAENTYLQLRQRGPGEEDAPGTPRVWMRWPQSISLYQPQLGDDSAVQVVGARLVLQVTFNEFAPQVDASNTLDELRIDVDDENSTHPSPVAAVEYDFEP